MDVRQRGAGGSGMATTDLRKIPRTKSSNGNKSKTASHVMVWKIVTWGVCLVLVALCLVLAVAGKNPLLATTKGGSSATNTRGVKEQAQKDAVDRKIYEQLQEENKVLKQRVNNLQNQQQQQQANSKTTNDGAAAAAPDAKKIKRLIDYKKRMHEMIQFISKRNLVQKYGHGPHFVEILVSYDPGSNVADAAKAGQDTETLLIELAPTDEMPATVFWFLEQVNATLFDGCSFHRNAHHVVQGGPAVNFETVKGQGPQRRFTESKLESVPFQEYSPNFPHIKYTLGYAGRPGGPDFYVSTVDNSRNHGPGGQGSYEEVGEADPCFAKVVPGFEPVVDRLHKSAIKPGDYNAMQHNIAIRHMRLLSEESANQLKNSFAGKR